MSSIEVTDRYKALGIPYPDPKTMCKGPCEGIGLYPENDIFSDAWRRAHKLPHEAPCDGWHFVTCPDCGGTGKEGDE